MNYNAYNLDHGCCPLCGDQLPPDGPVELHPGEYRSWHALSRHPLRNRLWLHFASRHGTLEGDRPKCGGVNKCPICGEDISRSYSSMVVHILSMPRDDDQHRLVAYMGDLA